MRLSPVIMALSLLATSCAVHAQEHSARSPEALVSKSVQELAHGDVGSAVKEDVKALRSGPLLMHGNYCGIGNRPGTVPIDALDAACMRHDACTKTGALPSCGCDDRLRVAATAIAADPSTAPDVKLIATATASAMAVLVCKNAPPPAAKPQPESTEPRP